VRHYLDLWRDQKPLIMLPSQIKIDPDHGAEITLLELGTAEQFNELLAYVKEQRKAKRV
jgi:hypothetical protein